MRRPLGFFLLAGFAAMLAALVVYGTLKQREAEVQHAMVQSVDILVAAQDLPLGSKIDASSVKLTRWSRESLPAGAYEKPDAVIGTFVKSSFVTNEPIVGSKLFSGGKSAGVMPLLIPAGMRAMSVPVDEVSDIAGFVLPHSRVDVLVAVTAQGGPEGPKPFSKAVLQNVEVLAVAQEIEGSKETPQVVKVVTLLVSLDDAERLTLASHEGSLRLVMRNYTDDKIQLTRGVDMNDLLRAYSNRASTTPTITSQTGTSPAGLHQPPQIRHPMDKVDILRNGKSSESLSFIDLSMGETDGTKPLRAHRKHVIRTSAARRPAATARNEARPAPDNESSAATADEPGRAASAGAVSAVPAATPAADTPLSSDRGSTNGLLPHSRTIDIP